MTQNEIALAIALAQQLINLMSLGDKKSVVEIYGSNWSLITNSKEFGKKFKEAVTSGLLTNIKHNGIRSTGRCDEYERI